jgi:hypothetical protein
MMNGLRQPFRFFLENAGYCTPPGRAVCALKYARAEMKARADDSLRVVWEPDDCPDTSWCEDIGYKITDQTTVEVCRIESRCGSCGQWETVESLCGIFDADDTYRRVVEAELYSQVYANAA